MIIFSWMGHSDEVASVNTLSDGDAIAYDATSLAGSVESRFSDDEPEISIAPSKISDADRHNF